MNNMTFSSMFLLYPWQDGGGRGVGSLKSGTCFIQAVTFAYQVCLLGRYFTIHFGSNFEKLKSIRVESLFLFEDSMLDWLVSC